MEGLHTLADQLAAQLQHPDAGAVWNRAVEVFGDEAKAQDWMNTARDIFGGRSPRELVSTGDPAEQRRVLQVLLRIDYGVFS
jgi:putative toxin-antitoxin system antitoxin component (TIGR02293 family)